MKKSEIIAANYDAIIAAMADAYKTVLNSRGTVQEDIYIWSDGEIHVFEDVQGGNTYLVPGPASDRELFFVTTVDAPFFDPWDGCPDPAPDVSDEREAAEQAYIAELVKDYEADAAPEILDTVITDAKDEEHFC